MIYKKGTICYYIENNTYVRQGMVVSNCAGQYTIRISYSGAICLPESRLYRTLEEAAQMLPKDATYSSAPSIHPPQLH